MSYCNPDGLNIQMRQVLRWLIAAKQDMHPGIKFLHASYGVGNLDILRQIATDMELQKATGYDPLKLLKELQSEQDKAQKSLGFSI